MTIEYTEGRVRIAGEEPQGLIYVSEIYHNGENYHGNKLFGFLSIKSTYNMWGELIERETIRERKSYFGKNEYHCLLDVTIGERTYTAREVLKMTADEWEDENDKSLHYTQQSFSDSKFDYYRSLISDYIDGYHDYSSGVEISWQDSVIVNHDGFANGFQEKYYSTLKSVDFGTHIEWATKHLNDYYAPSDIERLSKFGWRVPTREEFEDLLYNRSAISFSNNYKCGYCNIEQKTGWGDKILLTLESAKHFGFWIQDDDADAGHVGYYLINSPGRDAQVLRVCEDPNNRISVIPAKQGEKYSVILVKDKTSSPSSIGTESSYKNHSDESKRKDTSIAGVFIDQLNPDSSVKILQEGQCGTSAFYRFYDNGDLVIRGSGKLFDTIDPNKQHQYAEEYESDDTISNEPKPYDILAMPWDEYRYDIKHVKCSVQLGKASFSHCYNLEIVELYVPTDTIPEETFTACHNLLIVKLKTSPVVIKDAAFASCLKLDVNASHLLDRAEVIERAAFFRCNNILSINASLLNPCPPYDYGSWDKKSRFLTIPLTGTPDEQKQQKELFYSLCSKDKVNSCTMPCIKSIGESAFDECHNIRSLVLPECIEYISKNAFSQCDKLEVVKFETSLFVSLGFNSIFHLCPNIKYCFIPRYERINDSIKKVRYDYDQYIISCFYNRKYTPTVCYFEDCDHKHEDIIVNPCYSDYTLCDEIEVPDFVEHNYGDATLNPEEIVEFPAVPIFLKKISQNRTSYYLKCMRRLKGGVSYESVFSIESLFTLEYSNLKEYDVRYSFLDKYYDYYSSDKKYFSYPCSVAYINSLAGKSIMIEELVSESRNHDSNQKKIDSAPIFKFV